MIAKMKKLTFLVYHKEYDAFLKSIRDLGVVHVATKAQGSAEDAGLQESIRLSTRYAAAIILGQFRTILDCILASILIGRNLLNVLVEFLLVLVACQIVDELLANCFILRIL